MYVHVLTQKECLFVYMTKLQKKAFVIATNFF